MNQLNELPRAKPFNEDFNYDVYKGKKTHVSLHRVPWDNSYKDVAYFSSNTTLNTFLDGTPSRVYDDLSYAEFNAPIRLSTPFNEIVKYNYVHVINFIQPVSGDTSMDFYYFITDVQYVSPMTTQITLQLDVFQTFIRTTEFGKAYLEQGHASVADQRILNGSRGVLTQPEGFNLGQDYQVVSSVRHNIALKGVYAVCVVSTTNLEGNDYGTVKDPKLVTATGSSWEGLANGANVYVFPDVERFKSYLNASKDTPWVTSAIISVTALPVVNMSSWPSVTLNGVSAHKPGMDDTIELSDFNLPSNFKEAVLNELPSAFRHLKKFTVFPYSFWEMSTYSSEPLVLKTELINGSGQFEFIVHGAPPSPRIAIVPKGYNGVSNSVSESYNVASWISNFPQFSIVNNAYINTIASQAHGLAQSYKSNDWAQNKALNANSVGYDQATAGMNLAGDLTENSVASMNAQTNLSNTFTGVRAITGGIGAVMGGASKGGAMGMAGGAGQALMGAINAGVDVTQNTMGNNIATNLARQQNSAQVSNSGYIRDTNKSLADFGAKGDYQNANAIINAKVEDAKLTQPTTSGTIGGDAFLLAIEGWFVELKLKTIPSGARMNIAYYWNRYGYATNRYCTIPNNFKCMSTFTYWKLKEVYIKSAECPEPMKRTLSGIFEKGVTVWHEVGALQLGNSTVSNLPIYGNYLELLGE